VDSFIRYLKIERLEGQIFKNNLEAIKPKGIMMMPWKCSPHIKCRLRSKLENGF
jgi:hypothetical protein